MSRPVRLITELVGTFIFLSVIALSGPIGPLAALPIGTALMAMVYMGGHISGAHYNPAVSLGAFLSRKLGGADMIGYWSAQLVGAALALHFRLFGQQPLARYSSGTQGPGLPSARS